MEWFLLVLAVLILLGLALWWLSRRGDTAPPIPSSTTAPLGSTATSAAPPEATTPPSGTSTAADVQPAAVDDSADAGARGSSDTTGVTAAPEVTAAAGDDGGPYGPGTAAPRADGSGPEGWTVKGDEETMLYHTEESPYYRRTTAAVWFESEETAQAAGFTRWRQR